MCVCVLQHHSPSEHEAGNRREPSQGDHRQGHLGCAAAAPQALKTEPRLSGPTNARLTLLHVAPLFHSSPCLSNPLFSPLPALHLIIQPSMPLLSSSHSPQGPPPPTHILSPPA